MLLLVWLILTQAHQRISCFFNIPSSDCIPRGFGSQVCPDEERDRPDPLEEERKSPGPVTVDSDDGSNNAGGEEDASAPAHADVCSYVRSEDGRDNFTGIGGGQGLNEAILVSVSNKLTNTLTID
jgi:hypothetical protein